ncbi:MAG: VCBS repeat-containing protein, partial [Planctomycetes bacterium]|nr:VCBS repeat-containing protein [Planctomycetota bacterium]
MHRIIVPMLVANLVAAQSQFEVFEDKTHTPEVAHDTTFVSLADADGDGDLDLFTIGRAVGAATTVQWFRNDGRGRFSSTIPLVTNAATALELADVDLDGDVDVLVVGQPCLLLINDGLGSFVDETPVRIGSVGASDAAFGDLFGNGRMALVLGDSVYANDGLGNFADVTAASLPGGQVGAAPSLGDIDGDGDLDIVSADRVLIGDNSTFVDETTLRLPAGRLPEARSLVDLDGDGSLDIYTGSTALINDGNGVFADGSGRGLGPGTLTVDIDGDGDEDGVRLGDPLASPDARPTAFVNDGLGRFVEDPDRIILEWAGWSGAVGDVDGNGSLDLVVATPSPNSGDLFALTS